MGSMSNGKCGCPHHKLNGILIFLAALTFLLGHLEVITMQMAHIVWPSLIMVFGLQKSFGRTVCKCCDRE